MTPEQREIMAIAMYYGGTVTKAQVVATLGGNYYCHGDKHISDRLSRMVKANLLKRIKPGVFEIGTGKKSKPSTIAEGQTMLFEK